MKSIKYTLITLALVLSFTPLSAAQEADFSGLVVAEDISPEARLAKKVGLTNAALEKAIEKVNDMRTKLEALSLEENSPEALLKNQLMAQTDEYLNFYHEHVSALAFATTLEEVNLLIDGIIEYRENVYSPGAGDILEYILVLSYTPSVLETANTRLETTNEDIAKLASLELIPEGRFKQTMAKAQSLLIQAQLFADQAKEALLAKHATPEVEPLMETLETTTSTPVVIQEATSTPEVITKPEIEQPQPTALAEGSLNTIKELYDLFLETGKKIERALGIQEGL